MSKQNKETIQQIEDFIRECNNTRKIVKLSISKFLQALSEGKIQVDNISDFERLVKLDEKLKEQEIHYMNLLKEFKR